MARGQPRGIRVEGAMVHLDADPARLLSQLRNSAGDVHLTAMTPSGDVRHERIPPAVRRARYRLSDRSIEATPSAAFVTITTGDRLVVAVLEGEVVVVTAQGDRTAVAAHETLVSDAPDAEPRVTATAQLAGDDRAVVDAAIEESTATLLLPLAVPQEAPTEPAPVVPEALAAEEVAGAEPGTATEVEADLAEEEKVERRGVAAGLAIGAVLAIILLVAALIVLPSDDEVAGPSPATTGTQAPTTTQEPTTTAAPTTTARPVADYSVRPTECRQSGSNVTLTGEITNDAAEPWSFSIEATFRDADGEVLDRAGAGAGPVPPGETAIFTITGEASRPAASCDIEDVEARPA